MQFRIADTFQASLNKLTNQEQKAVKITVFDLQADPSSPGLKFHKLDGAKDQNFWSVRVNRDIRLIVHRTPNSILITYVDHHDDAYTWAERRRIETHPRTGAAQLVEVRETVEEIVSPPEPAVQVKPAELLLFEDHPDDDELLGFGIPEEWLPDVRNATESGLFDLLEHLPQEAAEALLELATGGTPVVPVDVVVSDPFQHPDAQRRFRIMENADELEKALAYPWEKWTIFLHPTQQRYAEKPFNGPARVGGTAGTGKTVVALHRAHWLARMNPSHRVLLTTFSPSLAENLSVKLDRLVSNPEVRERVVVKTLADVALGMHEQRFGEFRLAGEDDLTGAIEEANQEVQSEFNTKFMLAEWSDVVDAWGLLTWEEYRDVPRLGRKTRLGINQRQALWRVFECVQRLLAERSLATPSMMYAAIDFAGEPGGSGFEHIVVDEAQDIGVAELRFVTKLAGDQPNGMFFAGDLGQRIFQTPFSWKSLGVDIRGRSFTLKVNYRTSHQIRQQADRLLPTTVKDIDGIEEERRGVVSVFDGVAPVVHRADTKDAEVSSASNWIAEMRKIGVAAGEIGVFVRSGAELDRASMAVERAGESWTSPIAVTPDSVVVSTMHLAKGLEFRAVAVIACDDEVIPDQDRIETVVDEADLTEVYDTERHLLYVACTRARDHLFLSGVEPVSEFLDDLEV